MVVTLRPYQRDAVNGAEAAWDAGARRVLTISATGTGKSTNAAEVVRRHFASGGKRALVLAQRRELLDQLAGRLESFDVRTVRGIVLNTRRPTACVASVQSVARRLDRIPQDAFDLVVLDECHHGVAPQCLGVLRHFPQARIYGMSATPDRADGASLGLAFETCVARYDIEEAVRDGHLVPARGIRVDVDGMDLSKVRTRPITAERSSEGAWRDIEDLHQGELGKAVIAPAAVEGITGPLLEITCRASGAEHDMRTVVFAVNIAHGRAITDSINSRRPDAARFVYGGMKMRHRRAVLAAFAAGEFQYLVNVALLIEGWDMPSVECVALARPTRSRVFVAQACGRSLRPCVGKSIATIIDFTSATSKFSLIGPEDVLGGAMVEPISAHRAQKPPAEQTALTYRPSSRRARFRTRAIDLMRRAGRAVRDEASLVASVVPSPVKRGARGVGRGVRRVWRMLVG